MSSADRSWAALVAATAKLEGFREARVIAMMTTTTESRVKPLSRAERRLVQELSAAEQAWEEARADDQATEYPDDIAFAEEAR